MNIKHIRWVAVVGLIAIVELQYVWLVNTYRITKESIRMQSKEVFEGALMQEMFIRTDRYKLAHGLPKDSTMQFYLDLSDDNLTELDNQEMGDGMLANRKLMSSVLVLFEENMKEQLGMELSLEVLDSVYAACLDSVGIDARVHCRIMDADGNVLRPDSSDTEMKRGVLETASVPLDVARTQFAQGMIVNPYWVIFQRMTLLLLATLLIMILVIVCIVWQIRIIFRQDKVAKLREDFSYAMIHDMKTPLSSILMGTQALELGRLDAHPEMKAHYFRILREEGGHLLSLIDKVLTLSKLENHRLKLEKEWCLLRPMLEDLAEKYAAKSDKEIVYRWNLQTDMVYADDEFLREALSNLIDNAVKYSRERVEITFSSQLAADGTITVSVRDNGFGIPLKDQSKIFEKYERASAAGRSRDGGSTGFGLGLNYVLRVMEAHGGRVILESIEGKYSEFTLVFPPKELISDNGQLTVDN